MKFELKKKEQGSVLIWGLVVGGVAGITLASYLTLISNRYAMTSRSMDWNQAMPVLEAGIEEGMTHVQDDNGYPAANGWTQGTVNGQTVYTKQRSFSDGSYYYVTIYNETETNPIIYSSGFVPSPVNSKGGYISRMVKVTTSHPKIFNNAVAATGPISMSGNNPVVDSYSSCLGPYGAGNSFGTNGSIATDDQAAGAISVGNANVYGTVITGPGGTVTTGPNGSAGSDAWNGSHSGVESGWSSDTMNVSFQSNSPPEGGPFLAPSVVTNAVVLTGGTNEMSSLSQTMIVTAPSVLYVTGNISLSGTSYIQINSNASLTLIMGGNATIGGNGIINGTGIPENMNLVGLNSTTSISFTGNAIFVGTINAPQASRAFRRPMRLPGKRESICFADGSHRNNSATRLN